MTLTELPFSARLVGFGSASGSVSALTIAGVMDYQEDLVVAVGTKSAAAQAPPLPPEVTWNGVAATEAGNGSVVTGNGLALVYCFKAPIRGPGQVIVEFSHATKPTEAVGIAMAVQGLQATPVLDSIFYSGSTGDTAPLAVTMSAAPNGLPALLVVPHVTMGPSSDATGFWAVGVERLLRLGGSTVTLDLAIRGVWGSEVVTIRKTDFTDRAWAAPVSPLLGTPSANRFVLQSSYHRDRF